METRDKSEELGKRIEDLEKEFSAPSRPKLLFRSGWYWGGGALGVPLLVLLGLVAARPLFVVTPTKKGAVLDRRKLLRWTLVASLAVYAAAYIYACRRAEGPASFAPSPLES